MKKIFSVLFIVLALLCLALGGCSVYEILVVGFLSLIFINTDDKNNEKK